MLCTYSHAFFFCCCRILANILLHLLRIQRWVDSYTTLISKFSVWAMLQTSSEEIVHQCEWSGHLTQPDDFFQTRSCNRLRTICSMHIYCVCILKSVPATLTQVPCKTKWLFKPINYATTLLLSEAWQLRALTRSKNGVKRCMSHTRENRIGDFRKSFWKKIKCAAIS